MLENIVMDYTIIAVVKKVSIKKKIIMTRQCMYNNSTPCSSLNSNFSFWRKKKHIILFSHCTGQTDCVSLINNFLSAEDLEYYTKPQGI